MTRTGIPADSLIVGLHLSNRFGPPATRAGESILVSQTTYQGASVVHSRPARPRLLTLYQPLVPILPDIEAVRVAPHQSLISASAETESQRLLVETTVNIRQVAGNYAARRDRPIGWSPTLSLRLFASPKSCPASATCIRTASISIRPGCTISACSHRLRTTGSYA
jgi:hypothetical protein